MLNDCQWWNSETLISINRSKIFGERLAGDISSDGSELRMLRERNYQAHNGTGPLIPVSVITVSVSHCGSLQQSLRCHQHQWQGAGCVAEGLGPGDQSSVIQWVCYCPPPWGFILIYWVHKRHHNNLLSMIKTTKPADMPGDLACNPVYVVSPD